VAVVFAVTTAFIAEGRVSAHRLDECLQAARIAVEPARVDLELDLTPGTAVAESIIADIDGDRDGALSRDEQRTYVGHVLDAVELTVDGRPLDVRPDTFAFPEVDALRRGEGTIHLRSEIGLPSQSTGTHHLFFRNKYRQDVSVYLANVLVPESERIAVSAQRHDAEQRDLTIDYVVRATPWLSVPGWLLVVIAGVTALTGLLIRPPQAKPRLYRDRSSNCSARL
jgi:hypothetical protein